VGRQLTEQQRIDRLAAVNAAIAAGAKTYTDIQRMAGMPAGTASKYCKTRGISLPGSGTEASVERAIDREIEREDACTRKVLTSDQLAKMRAMVRAGHTYTYVAKQLGVVYSTIRKYCGKASEAVNAVFETPDINCNVQVNVERFSIMRENDQLFLRKDGKEISFSMGELAHVKKAIDLVPSLPTI